MLCIIYFKQCNTYHDTHELIFDMYQQYTFCPVLDQKNLTYPQISWEFGNFNDQSIVNLSKNILFQVSYNYNEWFNMYRIAKVLIQPIYHDMIQSPMTYPFQVCLKMLWNSCILKLVCLGLLNPSNSSVQMSYKYEGQMLE